MPARFAACAAIVLGILLWGPVRVQAQEIDRVAAVVNDEAISLKEVDTRVRVALIFSNIPDSVDARRRVLPQVLRKMIDERLQLQEAARLKVSISAADLDSGIAMIEQQNRMPKGALLGSIRQVGLDSSIVRDQIRADLTWLRLTGRVLQPQIRIGDEEINDRLEIIKERQGKPEFQASEIFLPVEAADQEDEVRRLGERLLEQLQAGTNFSVLARQFSRSPTAANGGSMGWVTQDAVDEDLHAVLAKLGKGELSPLVRTSGGFHIVAVTAQRIAGTTANPEDAQVTFSQIVLPVPPKAPPKQKLLAQATELTAAAKTCDELEDIGRRVGAPQVDRVGPVRLGEVPVASRRVVASLAPGRVGTPIDIPEGILVAMVCSREEATRVTLPSREQVRRVIEEERLDMLSRRYIRDLRRAAFVDVRI